MKKPKLTSRSKILSVDDYLDQIFPRWQDGKGPDFSGPEGYDKLRKGLKQFAESILSGIADDLEKAAGAGMREALNLTCDSEWYERKRESRQRRTKAEREEQEHQERENEEQRTRYREGRLTQEEKLRAMGQLARKEAYHTKELEEARSERHRIEHSQPLLTAPAIEKQEDLNDEWPDMFE